MKMNCLIKYTFPVFLLFGATACQEGINETVESAYRLPVLPEPPYKFSRNGENSVDLSECKFLKAPVDEIFSDYMNGAFVGRQTAYNDMLKLYNEGKFGLKPREEVSASPLHRDNRETVLKDISLWFQTATRVSGLGTDVPSEHRNREAVKGATGYIGYNLADKEICFVDEKGISVAEVFQYATMGAIYLDKILNVHLSLQVLENKEVLSGNDQTLLLPGHNYTELEHHWDLGYGYYGFWKSLAQPDGLPALKKSHPRILQSFVRGRIYMQNSHYEDVKLQADTIRQELSRVVGVRIINLLIGGNTLANLKENPKRAFRFLSQAYGLIYASQFACDVKGYPLITYEEVRTLLQQLVQNDGFWETDRLLGDEKIEGSLRYIAARIGDKFGISPEEIRR